MHDRSAVSRRDLLGMAGAGGLGAHGRHARRARAGAAKRIEQFAPELEKIISTSEPIEQLASGLGGGANTEGPVWWKDGGYLLFSSIGDSKRMKYTPGQGLSVAKEETNGANGLTRDLQGRLVACEGLTRRVTRQEHDGSMTVIANSFQGRRLNKPNDVVVKSDGCVYFTDPWNLGLCARPDRSELQRRLSGHPRPRHHQPAHRHAVHPQRDRVLARTRASSTSTIRGAAKSSPTICCRAACWRGRPSGCSPICAAASPAAPTA